MSQPERFEILILGSGAGGKLLAWHMARAGRRTAVVERRYIGGLFPDINFIARKKEILGAEGSRLLRHAAPVGTRITRSTTRDKAQGRQGTRGMVDADGAAQP